MKVIFLDIDGVLNCQKTPNPRKFPYVVDRKLLTRLRRLLAQSKAKVVLSSTWRFDPIGRLAARSFKIPFIDVLPDLPGKPRRDEILRWLAKHPKVTAFVVIDDEDDGLDELPLFQPSSETGLSPEIICAVCHYLSGKRKDDMRCSGFVRLLQNAKAAIRGHDD